jgi:hypothetical protein
LSSVIDSISLLLNNEEVREVPGVARLLWDFLFSPPSNKVNNINSDPAGPTIRELKNLKRGAGD